MRFGLHSASSTFQRLLDSVVSEKYSDFSLPNLDDIVVFSENFEYHLQHLDFILITELRHANLIISSDKSAFCKKELLYLGRIVGQGASKQFPKNIKAINSLPAPTNVTGVLRILGMVAWYSKIIPNLTEIVSQ